MPFIFGIAGLILIVSGLRGTVTESNPNLVSLLKSDLTGTPNYTEWMAAIFIIGAVGYYQPLQKVSRALMTVVVLGLLVSNKGFFKSLQNQLASTDSNVPNTTTSTAPNEAAPSFTQTVKNLATQATPSNVTSGALSGVNLPSFDYIFNEFENMKGIE